MTSRTLHAEVKRRIIGSLSEGRWKHGEAIPSEQALARRFEVSVSTVRRAMSELVAENVLVRRQGSGTYVASHTRDYMLSVFFWIVDEKDRKELPHVEVLSYRRACADAATAARLRLQAGAPVIRALALQCIGGRPMQARAAGVKVAAALGLPAARRSCASSARRTPTGMCPWRPASAM